ncbi:MAG: hypothetical protein Ct9H90mP16_13420 [Candidatus Poseidoniales archaeon]|nr:MAG: hypothetical protein Ct9H90mP16_13420 [Candidatus Poseidoniales archaeon]
MHFTQTATINGEILCKAMYRFAINCAVSTNDTVSGDDVSFHAKVSTSMFDQRIDFLERAFVKSNSNRSLAVNFPRLCCASMRWEPPRLRIGPFFGAIRRVVRLQLSLPSTPPLSQAAHEDSPLWGLFFHPWGSSRYPGSTRICQHLCAS